MRQSTYRRSPSPPYPRRSFSPSQRESYRKSTSSSSPQTVKDSFRRSHSPHARNDRLSKRNVADSNSLRRSTATLSPPPLSTSSPLHSRRESARRNSPSGNSMRGASRVTSSSPTDRQLSPQEQSRRGGLRMISKSPTISNSSSNRPLSGQSSRGELSRVTSISPQPLNIPLKRPVSSQSYSRPTSSLSSNRPEASQSHSRPSSSLSNEIFTRREDSAHERPNSSHSWSKEHEPAYEASMFTRRSSFNLENTEQDYDNMMPLKRMNNMEQTRKSLDKENTNNQQQRISADFLKLKEKASQLLQQPKKLPMKKTIDEVLQQYNRAQTFTEPNDQDNIMKELEVKDDICRILVIQCSIQDQNRLLALLQPFNDICTMALKPASSGEAKVEISIKDLKFIEYFKSFLESPNCSFLVKSKITWEHGELDVLCTSRTGLKTEFINITMKTIKAFSVDDGMQQLLLKVCVQGRFGFYEKLIRPDKTVKTEILDLLQIKVDEQTFKIEENTVSSKDVITVNKLFKDLLTLCIESEANLCVLMTESWDEMRVLSHLYAISDPQPQLAERKVDIFRSELIHYLSLKKLSFFFI